jgi:CheY-like chemotaxis protein
MPRARILIVAPDEETGELYSLSLGSPARCGTKVVLDSDAAQEALDAGPHYDAILLDVARPPDWRACAGLASHSAETPVVAVTGWVADDRRYRKRAFDAGCAAYVLKPCVPDRLAEAVERVRRGERLIELLEWR